MRQATAELEESVAKEATVNETDEDTVNETQEEKTGTATWVLVPRKLKETRLEMLLLYGMTENELKLTKTSCVEEVLGVVRVQRLVMLLLSGMMENELKQTKTSRVEEVMLCLGQCSPAIWALALTVSNQDLTKQD